MNIAFAFTGKAGKKGHESWGMPDEPNLSDRLYIRSKREDTGSSRLEIEIRELEGVAYTYYTFMKARNVAQSVQEDNLMKFELHGRAGSFFAMTLRVENGYIPDVFGLYDIFENVFKQNIMGSVLTYVDTDDYLTYLIDYFAAGDEAFKETERKLKDQVLLLKMDSLPTGVTVGKGMKIQTFGIEDSDLDTINNALFKDSEVIVARDYKPSIIPTNSGDIKDEPEINPESAIVIPDNNDSEVKNESTPSSIAEKPNTEESDRNKLKAQNAMLIQRNVELMKQIDELTNGQSKKHFSDLYKSIAVVAACVAIVLVLHEIITPSPNKFVDIDSSNLRNYILVKVDSLLRADTIFKNELMARLESAGTANLPESVDATNIVTWEVNVSTAKIRKNPPTKCLKEVAEPLTEKTIIITSDKVYMDPAKPDEKWVLLTSKDNPSIKFYNDNTQGYIMMKQIMMKQIKKPRQ